MTSHKVEKGLIFECDGKTYVTDKAGFMVFLDDWKNFSGYREALVPWMFETRGKAQTKFTI